MENVIQSDLDLGKSVPFATDWSEAGTLSLIRTFIGTLTLAFATGFLQQKVDCRACPPTQNTLDPMYVCHTYMIQLTLYT